MEKSSDGCTPENFGKEQFLPLAAKLAKKQK
jgi:hypothetical protein